ncbi:MAG: TetR/AcrR family transcriptional regulator [Acidimicrobiaceae bacterium]|nr:TetR/AcrR family transcriptional regulator [Acidimicrobiaceae bacterium]
MGQRFHSMTRRHASRGDGAPRRRQDPETTTQQLLEAASQEFIERGYEAARVGDIARRVGVTAGAVYARWPHKSDVLVAALEYTLEKTLPEQELKNLGDADAGSFEQLALLGTNLLAFNPHKDVVTQVFGSARNNEAIRECLLEHLDEDAGQLSRIVDQMKEDGFVDPDYSTTAIAFLCQALGIGAHLLITAKLPERRVPSEDEWNSLLAALIGAVEPDNQPDA